MGQISERRERATREGFFAPWVSSSQRFVVISTLLTASLSQNRGGFRAADRSKSSFRLSHLRMGSEEDGERDNSLDPNVRAGSSLFLSISFASPPGDVTRHCASDAARRFA